MLHISAINWDLASCLKYAPHPLGSPFGRAGMERSDMTERVCCHF